MTNQDDLGLSYPFPASTYRARLKALRERLTAEGLDGLIAVAQETLFYLFGYDQLGYWVFQAVWIPADETAPVRGLCRAPDAPLMRRSIGLDETVIWWDDDEVSPVETLVNWVVDAGASRVGIELTSHALLPDRALEIQDVAARHQLELVSASGLVMSMRERKAPDEREYMRRAGIALGNAFRRVDSIISPGIDETSLAAEITASLMADGCDPSAVPHCIASGPRTLSQTHLSAKPVPIPAGDVVTVEFGASVARYHAVGFRTYFTPGANPAYLKQYNALVDAVARGIASIAPDTWSTDIAEAIHETLDESGSGRRGRHVGYGIGLGFPPTWLELIRLKSSQRYRLEPGMTFFLFVGAPTNDGLRYLGVGDPVMVTETGVEYLMPNYPLLTAKEAR